MALTKLTPKLADKHFNEVYRFYRDLNEHVYKEVFFGSLYSEDDVNLMKARRVGKMELHPILFGQMGILYNLCPKKYDGVLNNALMDFFGYKFHKNVLFLLTQDGFLGYIMVMQTNKDDRIAINNFFAHHLKDLHHYQYYTSEYDPFFDNYKLLWAKTRKDERNLQDIVLTFI